MSDYWERKMPDKLRSSFTEYSDVFFGQIFWDTDVTGLTD